MIEALRYKPEGRGFDSRCCHWNFSLTSFRPRYGPGVDSASNGNEFQEYSQRIKVAGAWGRQPYHLHVPSALKCGSLNLLETSGSVQAGNGIVLLRPTSKPSLNATMIMRADILLQHFFCGASNPYCFIILSYRVAQ